MFKQMRHENGQLCKFRLMFCFYHFLKYLFFTKQVCLLEAYTVELSILKFLRDYNKIMIHFEHYCREKLSLRKMINFKQTKTFQNDKRAIECSFSIFHVQKFEMSPNIIVEIQIS